MNLVVIGQPLAPEGECQTCGFPLLEGAVAFQDENGGVACCQLHAADPIAYFVLLPS